MKSARRRLGRLVMAAVSTVAVAAAAPAAQKRPALGLDDLLRAGAAYVDGFERECASIVASEQYVQTDKPPGHAEIQRRLRADVVLVHVGGSWFEFRDVFEVDGQSVHPRNTQLVDLFLRPEGDTIGRATRIADQSAHYDIGALTRSINLPMLALTALRRDTQPSVAFTLDGDKDDHGTRIVVLQFHESSHERMVHTTDQAPARGRLWMEAGSGVVRRTELQVDTDDAVITVGVTYARLAGAAVWVPASMDEHYEIGAKTSSKTTAQVLQSDGRYGSMQIIGVPETMTGRKTYENVHLGLIDVSMIR